MPGGYDALSLCVGYRRHHARYEQWWREGYVECEGDLGLRNILRCRDHISYSRTGIVMTKVVGRGSAHSVNQFASRGHTSRDLVGVSHFGQVAHQLVALDLDVL